MGHGHGHGDRKKYVGQGPELIEFLNPKPFCSKELEAFENCVAEKKKHAPCIPLIKKYNMCMRKPEPFY